MFNDCDGSRINYPLSHIPSLLFIMYAMHVNAHTQKNTTTCESGKKSYEMRIKMQITQLWKNIHGRFIIQ
jgi:hypothetical protein